MSAKTKSLVEHYIIAVAVAAVGIWQTGNHHLKSVAWAAVVGVLGPVLKSAYEHAVVATGNSTKK
jgi:hypothetical protein